MPLMSPPPPSTPPMQPRRRLSSRRGSMTAFDPYAQHAETNHHPDRSSFSTLTIVRVPPQQQAEQFPLHEPPSQRRHPNHARTGSGGRGPNPGSPGGGSGRLSFAFSTFAPPGGGQGRGERSTSPSTSPSSSPRLRPSSPHRLSSTGSSKPRLSADQLYDVAHRSTNPGYLGSAHQDAEHKNATFTPLPPAVYLPFIDRPNEVAILISTPPTKKLFALLSQTFPKRSPGSGTENSTPPSPSSMTLDDIPSDPTKWVYSHLVTFATQATRSVAPDALFVALLRKCILHRSELIWERVKGALGVPPELDVDLDVDFNVDEEGNVFDSSSSEGGAGSDIEDGGMKAKGHWEGWDSVVVDSPAVEKDVQLGLLEKDKEKNPEEEFKAQINAALTAPPRVKAIALERTDSSGSGQTTISPTPRPRNSPPRKHKTLLSEVTTDGGDSESASSIPKIITEEPTPSASRDSFESVVSRRNLKNRPARSSSLSSWLGSTVASPTGEGPEPEPTWAASTPGDFGSNVVDFGLNPSTDDEDEMGGGSPLIRPSSSVDVLSVEPLVSSPSLSMLSPGNHPPPLSLEGGGGGEGALGDIVEGDEEEEENGGAAEKAEKEKEEKEKEKEKEKEAMRIQGLRFSLSPTLSTPGSPVIGSPTQVFWSNGGSHNGSTASSPVIASKRPLSWGSSSSRRSSFGAGSPGGGLTRTGSSGSLTRMAIQLSSMDTGGSLSRSGSFGSASGFRYDPVGDRVPGNPLFPSNFARLTPGPTLAAKYVSGFFGVYDCADDMFLHSL
ncbi:hypothetical protein AAF712_010229 [Marasmius tenuissimus]|uniref:Uncharacterized protein n=1 Tax=Marasmius tenuissimus TaxID=585030 RepID=A0ABR2ZNI2_9AGAR